MKIKPVKKEFDTKQAFITLKSTTDLTKKKKLEQKIAENNIGLITHTINKYFRDMGLTFRKKNKFDDLISIGTIGLMQAINKFEPERENQFSTYATFWIKQSIRHYLNNDGLDVPAGDAAANMIWRYKKTFGDKPINEITADEIMNNEFVCKNLTKNTVEHYLDRLKFRNVSMYSNDSVKAFRSKALDSNEIDSQIFVRDALNSVWSKFSKDQKNKLKNFCETPDYSSGNESNGSKEFELVIHSIFKKEISSKQVRELANKTLCNSLQECIINIEG